MQLIDGTRVPGTRFRKLGRQEMMMKGIESANQDMGFRVGVGGGVSGVRVRDNNALSQGSPLMVYLLKGYLQGSVSRKIPAKKSIIKLYRNSGLKGVSKKFSINTVFTMLIKRWRQIWSADRKKRQRQYLKLNYPCGT